MKPELPNTPLKSLFEEILTPTPEFNAVSDEIYVLMDDLYERMYHRGVIPRELTTILLSQANYVGAKRAAMYQSLTRV